MEKDFSSNIIEGMDSSSAEPTLRKPTLQQAGILYFIAVILLLFVGSKVQRREFYSGILITEFILIALPAIVMLYIYRFDMKKVLRLNRVSALNLLLVFLIMVFAIPIVGVLNLLNYALIKSIFGKIIIEQPPVPANLTGLLLSVLVIGGSAGICEEILFRGTIQRALERFGAVKSILLTSFLFGLMHVDFQKLLGTFLLGALIGFIVYRSNSLFSGMFAHFTNNSVAVLATYFFSWLTKVMKDSGMVDPNLQKTADLDFSAFNSLPLEQRIAGIVFWAFVVIACIIIFIGLMYGFIKSTSGKPETVQREAIAVQGVSLLWFLPGILSVSVIYCVQGIKLLGLKSQMLESIFRFLELK